MDMHFMNPNFDRVEVPIALEHFLALIDAKICFGWVARVYLSKSKLHIICSLHLLDWNNCCYYYSHYQWFIFIPCNFHYGNNCIFIHMLCFKSHITKGISIIKASIFGVAQLDCFATRSSLLFNFLQVGWGHLCNNLHIDVLASSFLFPFSHYIIKTFTM